MSLLLDMVSPHKHPAEASMTDEFPLITHMQVSFVRIGWDTWKPILISPIYMWASVQYKEHSKENTALCLTAGGASASLFGRNWML